MSGHADHWDRVYAEHAPEELSWYQREPSTSLRLVREYAPGPDAAIVDVGAGESLLVDRLVDGGFTDVTVVDVSCRALDAVRARLGARAGTVTFAVSDVLTWQPARPFDVWHDRAVLHFLAEAADREGYVERASRVVRSEGVVILGVFGDDGPLQCSGLPVARYSADELARAFCSSFVLVAHEREEHVTPRGVLQPFTWVVLRRR